MNTIREVEKINQEELERGIAGTPASWHAQYSQSAWCYVGNLDHQLTEGDVLCIMSQFGEIEDIHLVRDEDEGKSRGFGFVKYEDARSCVLAVDNFVGTQILGRSLRVDHVEQYRLPKKLQEQEQEQEQQQVGGAGHAYRGMEFENKYNVHQGVDLFAPPQESQDEDDEKKQEDQEERRRRKEERQRKRQEKEERRRKREGKRERKEEKKRRKRARHRYHDDDDDDDDDDDKHREDPIHSDDDHSDVGRDYSADKQLNNHRSNSDESKSSRKGLKEGHRRHGHRHRKKDDKKKKRRHDMEE